MRFLKLAFNPDLDTYLDRFQSPYTSNYCHRGLDRRSFQMDLLFVELMYTPEYMFPGTLFVASMVDTRRLRFEAAASQFESG